MTHENIVRISFKNKAIYIETDQGEIRHLQLSLFPKLGHASKEQLEAYTISPLGIHWEELDEDLSFEGFFNFRPSENPSKAKA